MPTRITDPDDPRVADYRRLNDTAFRRTVESPGPFSPGRFVAEGWVVLERALAHHAPIRSILVDERRVDRLTELDGASGVPTWTAAPPILEAIVGFDMHRGVVAVGDRRRVPDADSLVRRSRRLLVLEGVTDGENLGALLRSAAALGADGVVVDTTSGDPWSRRAIRTSMGAVFAISWCRTSIEVLSRSLLAHRVLALTPSGGTDLADIEPDSRPCALLVGAEGPGLTRLALDQAEVQVRIGMHASMDSLNVAAAASVAMWKLF